MSHLDCPRSPSRYLWRAAHHIVGYKVPSNCLLNIRCINIIGNPIVSLLTEKHGDFVLKYWTSYDDLKCFCLFVAAMEAKRMQSPHTLQGPSINNESKFTFIWYITGYFIHSSLFIIASVCTLNVSRERCIRKMEAVIKLHQAFMSPHSSQAHNFSSIRPACIYLLSFTHTQTHKFVFSVMLGTFHPLKNLLIHLLNRFPLGDH